MPNKRNVEGLKQLEDKIKDSANLVVTQYKGMTTPELNDLRAKLKPLGCEYAVVKNTLTRIALKNSGLEDFSKYFSGPTAMVFQKGDPSALSKAILEFTKTNDKLKILAGYLTGKVLTEKEIKVLANLPPREVLLTQIAVMLNTPMQKIANVLNAPIQKFAQVLKALEQQKSKAA